MVGMPLEGVERLAVLLWYYKLDRCLGKSMSWVPQVLDAEEQASGMKNLLQICNKGNIV